MSQMCTRPSSQPVARVCDRCLANSMLVTARLVGMLAAHARALRSQHFKLRLSVVQHTDASCELHAPQRGTRPLVDTSLEHRAPLSPSDQHRSLSLSKLSSEVGSLAFQSTDVAGPRSAICCSGLPFCACQIQATGAPSSRATVANEDAEANLRVDVNPQASQQQEHCALDAACSTITC